MASKDKDPAFLFYPKDWYSGTAEMLPHEKGVYVDFLCYQHQNEGLPNDTLRLARIAGLSKDDFTAVWDSLKDKFYLKEGRLFNKRLSLEMEKRKVKSKRNTISGTFASVLRKTKLPQQQYQAIKSLFSIDDFIEFETERLTERLTEWVEDCLKSIGNGNVDIGKGGAGGNPGLMDLADAQTPNLFPGFSANFLAHWEKWKKYLTEKGKAPTYTTVTEHVSLLRGQTESKAVEMISYSINGGYASLYAPRHEEKAIPSVPKITTRKPPR